MCTIYFSSMHPGGGRSASMGGLHPRGLPNSPLDTDPYTGPWRQTPVDVDPLEADPPGWSCDLWYMLGSQPPPVDRRTDTCKNTTLPQTSFAGGKNNHVLFLSERCSSSVFLSMSTKKQLETCKALKKNRWSNKPHKESYTNHYWVHVVSDEAGWKKKTSLNIQDLVPQRKNITEVIRGFKRLYNVTSWFFRYPWEYKYVDLM